MFAEGSHPPFDSEHEHARFRPRVVGLTRFVRHAVAYPNTYSDPFLKIKIKKKDQKDNVGTVAEMSYFEGSAALIRNRRFTRWRWTLGGEDSAPTTNLLPDILEQNTKPTH